MQETKAHSLYLPLGIQLSVLCRLKGVTQEDLAKKCSISRTTINRYFTGKNEIRAKDLAQILNELGIHLHHIITQEISVAHTRTCQAEASNNLSDEINEPRPNL